MRKTKKVQFVKIRPMTGIRPTGMVRTYYPQQTDKLSQQRV